MILNKRPAKIGNSVNARSERHGDELVPAMDVPLQSVMLPKNELNSLMRDKTFWDRVFNERKDGFPEPANTNIKAWSLTDKYEHTTATILVGLHEREFVIEDCKASKLTLSPCVGGLTELCVTLQILIDDKNTALFEFMGKDCQVEMKLGDRIKDKDLKQPELPLDASEREEEKPAKRSHKRKETNGETQPAA